MHQPDVATQADCPALTTLAIAYHEAARAVVGPAIVAGAWAFRPG